MKKITIAFVALILLLVVGGWIAVRVLLAPERVRATVEARASAALGEQVRIGSAAARLFPRVGLELRDISIANTSARLESVSIETGLRPLFSRRVENALVTVAGGRVEIPWFLALLSSLSQAPASPVESAPGLTIVSVRAIELRGVVLTAGKHELRVDADGLFQQDRLEISRLDAKGEGTSLSATGALTSLMQVRGAFAVEADALNLDALLALASAATSEGPARDARPRTPTTASGGLSIEAVVKARAGRVASILVRDLSAQMHLTPAGVRLQPASLRAFDGRFSGRVNVDTRTQVPETSVAGEVAGVDVAAVSAFAGSPGAMTGRLSGRTAVACACLDLAGVRARMNGDGRFEIADGAIPGLQMVRTVVLAFGRPASDAPSGSGERFSKISANFVMSSGTLATSDLSLASKDFDMRGQGTVSAITGAIALKADVVLSRELSQQAGRDLYRYARQGDRIILPATLSGTVASPRVFIDIQQALGRALKNEMQERARSLLDRLLRRKPGGV